MRGKVLLFFSLPHCEAEGSQLTKPKTLLVEAVLHDGVQRITGSCCTACLADVATEFCGDLSSSALSKI